MTLGEYLETYPNDRLLYIGAQNGFFFAGMKSDLDLEELDTALSATYRQKLSSAKQRLKRFDDEGNERRANTARKCIEKLEKDPYKPIAEREIDSIWERVTEDATNIKIKGVETGSIWSVKEGTGEWNTISLEYNADILAQQIVKTVVDEYRASLMHELRAFRECLNRLEEYRADSAKHEAWLRSEDMKILTAVDPEAVIKMAMDATLEDILEIEGRDEDIAEMYGEDAELHEETPEVRE